MPRAVSTPQGPTKAEVRMFDVWDVFDHLLRTRPQQAAQFAYEAAELAEKYQSQPKRTSKGTTHDCPTP